MKLGMIIMQGSEKEVRQEFNILLEKTKKGFGEEIDIKENEFIIKTTDLKITFILDECLKDYAIYQIIN